MGNTATTGPPDPGPSPPAGERRQVTALFYDIVDSTSLLYNLDPEDFGEAQRAVHSAVASVIQRYEGSLHQIIGDGGCAFFGYPTASEDAAEMAVNAALDIVRRCQDLGGDRALPVRVGVATGTVVVHTTGMTALPGQREIIGLAVNLAARLQSFAQPNSVLVSDTTYRLTGSAFDYEKVDPVTVKGFSELQQVWRPLQRRETQSRFEARRRTDTPLVSRQQEMATARQAWDDAVAGAGHVLFLSGEPGIGKSRLVSELAAHVEETEAERRLFQCQPRGHQRPLHAIVDRFIRELRQHNDGEEPDEAAVRAYLSATAPGVPPESLDVLALLAELNPGRGRGAVEAPSQDFAGSAVRALTEVLRSWSARSPQFLVLEDFQWADALTKHLVSHMAEDIGRMRVLLVITSREPVPQALAASPHTILQDLSRLAPPDVARLVEEVWKPLPVPRRLAAFIEQRSEGVPLFVEELAQLLKDKTGGAAGYDQWDRILKEEGVSTLKDLLLSRISSLGPARRVAQMASAVGREFSAEHLCAIAPELSPDQLLEQVEALIAGNIVHPLSRPDETAFRFRHTLFQEAAYDSLLRSEQRDLHRRIVAASRNEDLPALPDESMAWHCEQAGYMPLAAEYAIKASEGYAMRSALHEARNLLASAESCLSRAGPVPEHDGLMLRLLAIRGPVEMALHGAGSREARQTYEQAVAICRNLKLTDREQWFPLYWGWWVTSTNAEAVTRSRVIVADLEKSVDPEIRLQAFHCSWATQFHAGHHAECLSCIEQGLALYNPERAAPNRTRFGGHDAKVCALAERGQSLWFRGEREAAVASIEEAQRWAEETGHLGSICHALDVSLIFYQFERDAAEVLRLAERLSGIAESNNLPNCEAKADIFSGWARCELGEVAQGRALFERGLQHQRDIGTEEDLPLHLDMRAATLEREGRDDLALRAIDEALDCALQTSDAVWLPELYRRRAELGVRCGREARWIDADLTEALRLAQAQGAHAIVGRVRRSMAQWGSGS